MTRPTVCLAMIVRDEAAVVERCLASVRPLVDTWLVVDTGSTDATPELVGTSLADLPGELVHRPWRDFGTNRSELLALARDRADYLLLLDADMTVDAGNDALAGLTADSYLLEVAGEPSYWMPYLVRSALPWRYVGVTHEYLTADRDVDQRKLPGLRLHHHADGGSRADKFERDRRLLTAELRTNPDDPRTVFYLAQTHRDLGRWRTAVDLYRRRAALGGWAEEVFYALYQVGVLLAPHDWPRAADALCAAWDYRPTRAEPLHDLARGLRERERYPSAYLFATQGNAIPPTDDILFVTPWIYRWGCRFEQSIAAYWTGRIDEARQACLDVLAEPDLPDEYRRHAERNLEFCRTG